MSWLSRFLDGPKRRALDELLEESAAGAYAAPWSEEQPCEAPGAPPEEWSRAMGIEPEALEAPAARLSAEEGATAAAVLRRCEDHRPASASFPSVSLELLDRLRAPDADAAAVVRAIETDAALASGVLVLARSALRGLSRVGTIREAAARLGLGEVTRIAAALSLRSLFRSPRAEPAPFGPIRSRLFHHAVTVARAGADLARLLERGDPHRAFLGGMLHDVGKPLALGSAAALLREGEIPQRDAAAVERVLHAVHVPAGVEAHAAWGLPPALAAIAEWHHLPEIAAGPEQVELHVVRLTSALELLRIAPGVSPAAPAEVMTSARALGLGPARVQSLRAALTQHGEWVRMLFGAEAGGPAAMH